MPATIIGALSTPSIYSHIRYSRPRDIANVRGETDEEIDRYITYTVSQNTQDTELESKITEIIQQMSSANCDTDLKRLHICITIYAHIVVLIWVKL